MLMQKTMLPYELSNDAGGLFRIGGPAVRLLLMALWIYEAVVGDSHDIAVLATSTDGSTSSKSFTISVTDDPDEHRSGISDSDATPNQVQENSSVGDSWGHCICH